MTGGLEGFEDGGEHHLPSGENTIEESLDQMDSVTLDTDGLGLVSGIAEVVEDTARGRYLVAATDLSAGTPLQQCLLYAHGIAGSFKKRICAQCFAVADPGTFALSCKQCSQVFYCSQKCLSKSIVDCHHIICSPLRRLTTFKAPPHEKSIMKTILYILLSRFREVTNGGLNSIDNSYLLRDALAVEEKEKLQNDSSVDGALCTKDDFLDDNSGQFLESRPFSPDRDSNKSVNGNNNSKSPSRSPGKSLQEMVQERIRQSGGLPNRQNSSVSSIGTLNEDFSSKIVQSTSIKPILATENSSISMTTDPESIAQSNSEIDNATTTTNEVNLSNQSPMIAPAIKPKFAHIKLLQSHLSEWQYDDNKDWKKSVGFILNLLHNSGLITTQELTTSNSGNVETNFLLNLISQVESNGFGIWSNKGVCMGHALYPTASFYNHSCDPNCDVDQTKNLLTIRLKRDVVKGTPLTISYIDTNQPLRTRRNKLLSEYYFLCCCERCMQQEASGSNTRGLSRSSSAQSVSSSISNPAENEIGSTHNNKQTYKNIVSSRNNEHHNNHNKPITSTITAASLPPTQNSYLSYMKPYNPQ